jgi:hypothetical protein
MKWENLPMSALAIHLDEQHPRNAGVIQYRRRHNERNLPPCAAPDSFPQPHMELGSHPDIVGRLWDDLGRSLPQDCRCIVYGTPALVAPRSGIILAVAVGTQYGLRLPEGTVAEAVKAGVRMTTKWSDGGEMNIQREFGGDWVFGRWMKNEPDWLLDVYRSVEDTRDS